MFKSFGRGMLEIARAIDTGHAIRHGVRPRPLRSTTPDAAPSSTAAVEEPLAEADTRL